jgi:multiple sugar transport system substrate-binding protein
LSADAKKLTKYDANGHIERIGFIPWEFGYDNAMFTFGYLFGGDFYIPPGPGKLIGTVTADDPKNVEALQWLSDYAKQYDIRKMTLFHENSAGLSNDPFYVGTEAMCFMHIMQMAQMRKYAPTMDYGIAPEPASPGGEYPSGWIGGWSLAIPRGSAASAEAFEFMRWMCTSNVSTKMMGEIMVQFPAYRKSPYYDEIKNDPKYGVYYQIVSHSKHVRTLMPVQGYLMELLDRAAEKVLYGNADPKTALHEASELAQKRLDRVMNDLQRRESGGS